MVGFTTGSRRGKTHVIRGDKSNINTNNNNNNLEEQKKMERK
jgi:hypothetical protein